MSSLATNIETLDASDVGCLGCQHRVDVPGVAQVVCLAHLAVFSSVSGDGCQEFEPKAKPATAARSHQLACALTSPTDQGA